MLCDTTILNGIQKETSTSVLFFRRPCTCKTHTYHQEYITQQKLPHLISFPDFSGKLCTMSYMQLSKLLSCVQLCPCSFSALIILEVVDFASSLFQRGSCSLVRMNQVPCCKLILCLKSLHSQACVYSLSMIVSSCFPVGSCAWPGVGAARDAKLTFMVGGGDDHFSVVEKLLSLLGKSVVHCGAHGTGQVSSISSVFWFDWVWDFDAGLETMLYYFKFKLNSLFPFICLAMCLLGKSNHGHKQFTVLMFI